MRTLRTVTVAVLALALSIAPLAGLAAADEARAEEEVRVDAEPTLGPPQSTANAANPYTHYDCVGPGPSPLVADAHSAHTDTVTGFQFGSGSVEFSLTGLSLFTTGTCPVEATDGPVLSEDYSGHYHMKAVCGAGAANEGTVFLDWRLDIVAGLPFSQSSQGTPCSGFVGDSFELEITVSMSPTDVLFGVPIDPVGGIDLEVSQ